MIDVALSILALIAGGLSLELFHASWPPIGHPEEPGFHLVTEMSQAVQDFQTGNPS